MAAGDVVNFGPTSTANGSYLDLQPGAATEAVIHNLSYAGGMELYYYDGANSVKVDEDSTAGSRLSVFLHCTNTKYYRIKNVSGSAAYLAADGIQTK